MKTFKKLYILAILLIDLF